MKFMETSFDEDKTLSKVDSRANSYKANVMNALVNKSTSFRKFGNTGVPRGIGTSNSSMMQNLDQKVQTPLQHSNPSDLKY